MNTYVTQKKQLLRLTMLTCSLKNSFKQTSESNKYSLHPLNHQNQWKRLQPIYSPGHYKTRSVAGEQREVHRGGFGRPIAIGGRSWDNVTKDIWDIHEVGHRKMVNVTALFSKYVYIPFLTMQIWR